MAEPRFDAYMRPILEVLRDGTPRKSRDIKSLAIAKMGKRKEDFSETQKNGNLKYLDNIGFAISYLFMAGLLNRIEKATYQISEEGLRVLDDPSVVEINEKYLRDNYPEFKERVYGGSKKKKDSQEQEGNPDGSTPQEKMEAAERFFREMVKKELLSTLQGMDDYAFERLCLKVLLGMGYGYDDASGETTQKSGDKGIDGIIFGDKLGLQKIAYQSKRWTETVGRQPVSQFVTDFDDACCEKGVFITTSKFTQGAIDIAAKRKNLVLIDGDRLTDLMYEHGIGVQVRKRFEIKTVDYDFFAEYSGDAE